MAQQTIAKPGLPEAKPPPVLVVLCGGPGQSQNTGLPPEIESRLFGLDEAVELVEVEDACHRPKQMREVLRGTRAERVVIVACSKDYPEIELHTEARKAGIDPLGLQVVRPAAGRVEAVLAGAVARARAFAGSKPENLKTKLAASSQKVSRRSFFTLPPLSYAVVPTFDVRRCVAYEGCRACVAACPSGAIASDGDLVTVDRSLCQSCGTCVAVCPERAVELPGSSADEIEAEVTALLDAASGTTPPLVAFTCADAELSIAADWLKVAVPCISMLPVAAILGTLAAGADTVGLAGCDRSRRSDNEGIHGRLGYCRELLTILGGPGAAARVTLLGPASSHEVVPRNGRRESSPSEAQAHLFGKGAAAETVTRLAGLYGASAMTTDHESSPTGMVALDREACSGCWTCAGSCPTGALKTEVDDDEVSLTFDPSLCTACGECARTCPEAETGAIRVTSRTDLAAIARGRTTLHTEVERNCESCGAPVASAGMIRRLGELLGEDGPALTPRLGRFCATCRVF